MLKICDENKESIKFRFLGSNEIGARELSKFLEATVSTFEKIVSNSEEETYIKLNISSVEKGSFLIVLTSIVTKIPKFFETVKNSKEVIATFKECLEIKEKLKDKKVQVKGDGLYKDGVKIQNYYYKPTIYIMQDPERRKEVDKAICNFGENLPSSRELNIETEMGNLEINTEIKDLIKTPLVIEEEKEVIEKDIYIRTVTIKIPNLEMSGQWTVKTDHDIKVNILDENFKKKVLQRKFAFSSGQEIKVKIEEIRITNGSKETIHYNIMEVLELEENTQSALF